MEGKGQVLQHLGKPEQKGPGTLIQSWGETYAVLAFVINEHVLKRDLIIKHQDVMCFEKKTEESFLLFPHHPQCHQLFLKVIKFF